MNTKILLVAGVVVLIAAGGLVLDSLEKNRGFVDPMDEPDALPDEFVITPTGGGTFNVGEEIKAGFTMAYAGNHEKKGALNSRFFVDEASVFATSNDEVTAPSGKAIVPVNGTARLDGETVTYDLTGYTCAKEGSASIVFTKMLTRYDIDGVPQKSRINKHEQHWGGDAHVSVECVAEVEMVQIDVQNPAFQAGSAPLGANEAETGFLHEDGYRYYNGERVDTEDSILDDLR